MANTTFPKDNPSRAPCIYLTNTDIINKFTDQIGDDKFQIQITKPYPDSHDVLFERVMKNFSRN